MINKFFGKYCILYLLTHRYYTAEKQPSIITIKIVSIYGWPQQVAAGNGVDGV